VHSYLREVRTGPVRPPGPRFRIELLPPFRQIPSASEKRRTNHHGLVAERLTELRQFRWSSYRGYAGYAAPLAWVAEEPALRNQLEAIEHHLSNATI
jgi:hypothetical protein